MASFDLIDRKILNALQRDCRITNVELAKKVGTSPPSCLRRVRRLRKLGIIEAQIAIINPEKVGRALIAITSVVLARHSIAYRDQFLRRIRRRPEVNQVYIVTGDADAIVVAHFAHMEAFDTFCTELFAGDPNVARVSTVFAMRRLKFDPSIRFDEDSWDKLIV